MNKRKKMPKYRRLHRVLGLALIGITLLASISGIILNHRAVFSSIDFPRTLLSKDYSYENGRQASLRGSTIDKKGNLYFFGDAGVWLKHDNEMIAYNEGFPAGCDNNKVYDMEWFNGKLIAATHFGLFVRRDGKHSWTKLEKMGSARYVDLFFKDNSLVVLSRDKALITDDLQEFRELFLPAPEGYKKETSLFTLLWNLHSGEIFGAVGKLVVDVGALILIFLSLSGFIHFYLPGKLKGRAKKRRTLTFFKTNRSLHKDFGASCGFFLAVIIVTGMFLRPPLLIPIAGVSVGVPPGTHLDSVNPWQDKLRKGLWDQESKSFIFATRKGLYNFKNQQMKAFAVQPPLSVMGCTVLRSLGGREYLVGSFSGLFVWQSKTGQVRNALTGKNHQSKGGGRPISDTMVTGIIDDTSYSYIDYRKGILPLAGDVEKIIFPASFVDKSRMSLWNLSLEVHTGRIFESLVNMFYILYVPLSGLMFLVVIVTGYWWYVYPRFLKKNRIRVSVEAP